MEENRKPVIVTCDAGGTMTDIFLVDPKGRFSVGKAATTPHDESVGFWQSLGDALSYWDINLSLHGKDLLPAMQIAIYTGTTMLNTLLQRRGRKVGLLITKGFEDSFALERGLQAIAGYSYADRLHTVTHMHNPPLVPKKWIRGVTERVDLFGKPQVPIYESDVRQGVKELLEQGVEAIAILFLYSYINSHHEQIAAQVARQMMRELGQEVPIFLSSEVSPIIRELARLNSVVIQAYAAEPVREQLFKIESRLKENGFQNPLQTILSYGGLANIRYPRLYESVVSGPVGGILGAKYLGNLIGVNNLLTADMGGTSFDIGLITEGNIPIVREPQFARFVLNLPMVTVNSVGAGAGTYIRLDPVTKRVQLGPESAGADPGPVAYDMGNETPTVMDCDLILGIINPDYYLGGQIKLNKEKALRIFEEKIAQPLHLDVYQAAEGIVKLVNALMADQVRSLVLSRGFSPVDYTLLAFGGAGPLHMAGFTEGLNLKGVMTVPFAAAFSAFGCATVDYSHRYQKSTHVMIPPGVDVDDAVKMQAGQLINNAWQELEGRAVQFMLDEGFQREDITLRQIAFVRYGGQLDDVEVFSPVSRITCPEDMDLVISAFEDLYEKIYASGAKFPQAGYQILEVGVVSLVPKIKPLIERRPLAPPEPPPSALKENRLVYYGGGWNAARVYELDRLLPGNAVHGLAVIEAPNTTLFVPAGRHVTIDEWGIISMR